VIAWNVETVIDVHGWDGGLREVRLARIFQGEIQASYGSGKLGRIQHGSFVVRMVRLTETRLRMARGSTMKNCGALNDDSP
jgi:hypothetical protein